MTVHENNLEKSTPILVVDIYNQDEDTFIDKVFCITATIDNDSVNISPVTVADITDQDGDNLADKPYCIMATIDEDSVNISPIVVANISNHIDEALTDNAYCVVTAIENDLVNISSLVIIDIYDQIADALTEKGYYIAPQLLPEAMTLALSRRVTQLNGDDFQTAGIGRKQAFQLNQQIRSDQTRWLMVDNGIDASYLDWMSKLRTELNQRLYMGLFKYEAHYAHYSPGAYYQRHVDAFKGQSNRVLTTLLYLNPDWQTTDGGELVIYHPETEDVIEQILPEYGKFIVFLSDQFPHQVLKANRDRYSISGWFHINDSPEDSYQ
jgi:SM-20-related protein